PLASQNKVSCYGSGKKANNADLAEVAARFCIEIGLWTHWWHDLLEAENFKIHKNYTPSTSKGIDVVLTFKLNRKCYWAYDYGECLRYLRNPVDACNCGGENSKQGSTTWNDCLTFGIDLNTAAGKSGGWSPFDQY
ncbi:hypothetical protein C8A05DRAFT_19757, partial [Staphylotrichum tortipilum]